MRAVIMVGGRGSRLSAYSRIVPKPLLPVGGRPILEIICGQLAAAGFTRVTLALGYMRDYFRVFLAEHRALSGIIAIDVVEEETPLGTAGALANVPDLDETFLVMNGDVLTTLNHRDLVAHHRKNQADLTIATHETRMQIEFGVLRLDGERVTGYDEKPTLVYPVSMGVYVGEATILEFIRPNERLDIPDLALRLIAAGRRVFSCVSDGLWLDLGRPKDLAEADRLLGEHGQQFIPRKAA